MRHGLIGTILFALMSGSIVSMPGSFAQSSEPVVEQDDVQKCMDGLQGSNPDQRVASAECLRKMLIVIRDAVSY